MKEMSTSSGLSATPRWYWPALAGVTLVGLILRVLRLDHPMRYDESFSLMAFAASGSPSDWFNYLAPNNHVLHTLLEHLAVTAFGPAPQVARLPALLAGAALVPATGHLAYRLSGRPLAAVLAASLVACWSLLIEYSVNARGYSMVALASVGLALASLAVTRNPRSTRAWIAWALLAAAGAFTIPVMVYPVGIMAVVIIAQAFLAPARRDAWATVGRLGIALVAAGALTMLLYWPVVHYSGVDALLANRFVTPRSPAEVAAELPDALATTAAHWLRDVSGLTVGWIILGLVAAFVRGVRRRRVMLLLPPIAAVLLVLAALAQRVVPFPRVWLFLLPWTLAVAAAGLAAWPTGKRRVDWVVVGAVWLTTVGLAGWSAMRRDVMVSEDPATLTDAQAIVDDLAAIPQRQLAIVSKLPAWPSLQYYAGLRGIEGLDLHEPFDPACTQAVIIVGPTQMLEQVLTANPSVFAPDGFGVPQPWKTYPRSQVYIAQRAGIPERAVP